MTFINNGKDFIKFEHLNVDYMLDQIEGFEKQFKSQNWDTGYMKEKCENIIKFIKSLEDAWENDYRRDKFTEQIKAKKQGNEGSKCPRCGESYTGEPALSRKDNETEICSDCGIAEALQDFAISQKKHD